jgi:hypothetical protein
MVPNLSQRKQGAPHLPWQRFILMTEIIQNSIYELDSDHGTCYPVRLAGHLATTRTIATADTQYQKE